MPRVVHGVAILPLALAVMMAAGPESDIDPAVRTVLARDLKFSPSHLVDLTRGKIIKHTIDAPAPGEIAIVGAARVRASADHFVEHVRDIVSFKSGPDVLQIGRFSHPPTIEDLAPLTIGTTDLDLRDCRVGDCDIRLPAEVIKRFQHEIDWKASDANQRAAMLFKEVLVENLNAYVSGGPGRIVQYDDDNRTVRPVDDFAGLMKNSRYIGALVPGLPEHLLSFPSNPVTGAEDFLYWSKEKFGLTPFITVTHVTIVPLPNSRTYVITSKDVYSSRYFDASLALTIASGVTGSSDAFYLVYANRSRANALKGTLSGLRRSIVERRVRNSVEENLKLTRQRLETR